MCAPRVTRHTSILYSSSCHTRVSMGATIFFTAAMIRAFRSARSRGNGGTYCVHDAPMLTRVWQELEYRIDVCRVTRGTHIEHL
jgi:hypothetical protein